MQRWTKRMAAIFVLLLLSSTAVLAANGKNADMPKFYWGFYGDYNYTMLSSTNDGFSLFHWTSTGAVINPAIAYPYFDDGKGNGFSIGGLFEWNWKPTVKFGADLGYSLVNGKFYDDVCGYNILAYNAAGQKNLYDIIGARYYFKPKYGMINFMPYVQAKFWKGLYGKFGLNFAGIVNNKEKEYQKIKYSDPDGAYWNNTKGKESTKSEIDLDDVFNKFQFGVTLGLGYEFQINKKGWVLAPEAKFNYGVTKLISDIYYNASGTKTADINANTLSFGLALKIPIFAQKETEKAVSANQKYTLNASLKTYGINNEGKKIDNPTIKIEEFETEEVFPLLSSVYFTPGKSTINDTRVNKLTDLQVSNFREEDLTPNSVELNHDMLNLVAYRMYDNKNTAIVLTGYANPDGEDAAVSTIANDRATAVKNYLIQVWGITPDRIGIKTGTAQKRNTTSSKDYTEENAKVTIAPADANSQVLFTPLNKIYIDKVSNPPMAEFNTSINAQAGLDNYQLSIAQNGKTVKTFNGASTEDVTMWTVDNVKVSDPLDVTLIAKDKAGQKVQVDKQMKVDMITLKEKRDKMEGDYKVTRYSLILFDFDKSDISANDQNTIQIIKKEIKPNSKVVISGYADRTGASDYNKQLSQKRCQEVQKALGVSNATLKPYGNEILLFDNSTAEGRALSRTVRVEILSPVK